VAVTDLGEAVAIADRVRRNFASAAAAHGADGMRPTVSVGVTLGCDPQVPVSALLASADQALYRAKANGRDRVENSEPVTANNAPRPATPAAGVGDRRKWRKAAVQA